MQNSKFQIPNSKTGEAMMTAVIFFLLISLFVVLGLVGPATREAAVARELIKSKQAYFLAEAGMEDVIFRIFRAKNYSSQETLQLDGFFATTTIQELIGGEKIITSQGEAAGIERKIKAELVEGTEAAFHFGVQVGDGGLMMENNSLVSGNVYSNGPVQGANSNLIKGDAVSAGAGGSVNGIHATGTVYSHNILNSVIDQDAYYQTMSNTIVMGALYPQSPDQSSQTLPISDQTIEEWEQSATTTIISSPCPYEINSDITLGPAKITCDVEIEGSPTVTLAGPLWIKGNLEVENTAVVRLASSLGKKSLAVIVDNPDNRLTSSKIILQNSAQFQNSGTDGSYILLISQNKSAESGGGEKAIEVANSVSGELMIYSGHGEILLENSVNLREVTAYRIRLQNTAKVIYRAGLANLLFNTGPAGSFSIKNWQETL